MKQPFCNGIPFRLFPCGFRAFATEKKALGSKSFWISGFVLPFDESKLISKVLKSILSQETNGRRSKHTFRFSTRENSARAEHTAANLSKLSKNFVIKKIKILNFPKFFF